MNPVFKGGREREDDDPVVIDDPTTGFHPDQLESYPLQRVGRTLYIAYIEAVAGSPKGNAIMIDASSMGDYAHQTPAENDFYDVPVTYGIPMPDPGKSYRGLGSLVIGDLQEYEAIKEPVDEHDLTSVLFVEEPLDELTRIGRLLEDDVLSVEVQEGLKTARERRRRHRQYNKTETSPSGNTEEPMLAGSS